MLIAARGMERRKLLHRPDGSKRARTLPSKQMRYQFVDCRWELGDPAAGKRAYLSGHIPGASFLDVDRDLSGPPGVRGRHPLPLVDAFAHAAGRAGVGAGVFVVAYGGGGGPERLWWLLRHFGHDACAAIDFESWRGPLTIGEEDIEPAEFIPRPRADDTIEADELARRLGELVLVDARIPSRWRGEANPIDRKPGRIPGALNAPWNEPLPELPDGELVAYCGSGVTASVILHRLHLAGRDGKLYPGSWSEWEQRQDVPFERSQG
jgi:thiosulfate/3-mercaptopyruvate sulfurtransferase